jgi:hypothetical protein
MTPRPCRRGTAGQRWAKKENGKAPSVAGGAPEKIPVRNCQRTRNILGSPAQGGLKNAELPHRGGGAIEDAHDDTPKTKKSSRYGAISAVVYAGLIQPNRAVCLYAISQLGDK